MRVAILSLALVAGVTALPRADPQFETIGLPATTTAPPAIIPPVTTKAPKPSRTKKHKFHKEPTPTFKLSLCECPKPIVPINQFSKKEKCEFEFAHSMACFFRGLGACPSPTLACS